MNIKYCLVIYVHIIIVNRRIVNRRIVNNKISTVNKRRLYISCRRKFYTWINKGIRYIYIYCSQHYTIVLETVTSGKNSLLWIGCLTS